MARSVALNLLRIFAAVFTFVALVISAAPKSQAAEAFYGASAEELAGPPGSLIRSEPLWGAPRGADAYRILYRSIGLRGEPIAVSGVIVVPKGAASPANRRIIAWAHPTTGIVPRCAPSLALLKFIEMPGIRTMIARGYILAATDYPGLGTPGPHPYLVGESEGRAVLDSVRAARQLAGPGTGHRFGAWGHSQGGQAVLYAAALAQTYAPDLELVGVAAAAPATDLGTLMRDDFASPGGKNLLAMTLWSWSRVFNAPLDGVVDPAAIPVINKLAEICLESPIDIRPRRRAGQSLQRRFLTVQNLTDREPWASLLRANTIGTLPSQIPVFLAQGAADDTVPPAVTQAYMRRLCDAGSKVQLMMMPGVGHGSVAAKSAVAAITWIGDRFESKEPPSSCTPAK